VSVASELEEMIGVGRRVWATFDLHLALLPLVRWVSIRAEIRMAP
jgi:hypothetical protein